jgi:hypothetical protein
MKISISASASTLVLASPLVFADSASCQLSTYSTTTTQQHPSARPRDFSGRALGAPAAESKLRLSFA